MFKAIVMICFLVNYEEQCIIFNDDWGPYITEENCVIRVNQMGEEIFTTFAAEYPITSMDGACVPDGEVS